MSLTYSLFLDPKTLLGVRSFSWNSPWLGIRDRISWMNPIAVSSCCPLSKPPPSLRTVPLQSSCPCPLKLLGFLFNLGKQKIIASTNWVYSIYPWIFYLTSEGVKTWNLPSFFLCSLCSFLTFPVWAVGPWVSWLIGRESSLKENFRYIYLKLLKKTGEKLLYNDFMEMTPEA